MAADSVRDRRYRCQLNRQQPQLGGTCRGAPAARDPGCLIESGRDGGVRSVGPQGEVARPLLRVRDRARQPAVKSAPLAGQGASVDGRGDEGVVRPKMIPVRAQQSRRKGLVKRSICDVRPHQALEKASRGPRECRDDEDRLPGLRRERLESVPNQRVEIRRYGKRLSHDGQDIAQRERPGQFEGQEWVAAGGIAQPPQDRSREAHFQPFGQQAPDRADAEGLDFQARSALGRERATDRLHDAPANPRTHRADHHDRLDSEPPQGEGDGLGRGRIPPLEVVHRDEERLGGCKQSKDTEHGQPEGHSVHPRGGSERSSAGGVRGPRRRVAPHSEEGDLQGTAPRSREVRCDLVDDRIAAQGGEPGERQVALRLGRPARQDTPSELPDALDGSPPERRLADPGGSVDGEQPARATFEKPLDGGQLNFAPDDLIPRSHRPPRCEGTVSAAPREPSPVIVRA